MEVLVLVCSTCMAVWVHKHRQSSTAYLFMRVLMDHHALKTLILVAAFMLTLTCHPQCVLAMVA